MIFGMYPPDKIINTLSEQLKGNFDLSQNVYVGEKKISLLASSNMNVQHYAVSKKIILDEIQIVDHIICFQKNNLLDKNNKEDEVDWLETFAKLKVAEIKHHMRSRFVGLMLITHPEIDVEIEDYFRKYYKFNWLKFGFKGWYELFFILLFTNSLTWIIPKQGKDFIPLLENLTAKLKTV